MPNWVQTKLVITGPAEALDRLISQLSQPYETEYYSLFENEYTKTTVEGEFLLWNIDKPDNLDLYYNRAENEMKAAERQAKLAEMNKADKEDLPTFGQTVQTFMEAVNERLSKIDAEAIAEKVQFEHTYGMDWYNWNVREWGTKWEIDNAAIKRVSPTEVIYYIQTAWSPPEVAITKLAIQYPEIAITARSHDEGDCFACEIHWAGGIMTFDMDLPINHYLFEELYGSCWVCEAGNWSDDEAREHYACPKSASSEVANA